MERMTRETVVEKFGAYLRHELSLAELVSWAESVLMESEFSLAHFATIRGVVARSVSLMYVPSDSHGKTASNSLPDSDIPHRSVSSPASWFPSALSR